MAAAYKRFKVKDKAINLLAPYFLAFYSIISLVSWMPYPYEKIYTLLNTGTPALLFRLVLGGLFVLYMILICAINRKLPPWRYTTLLLLICVYLGVLVLFQDRSYVYDQLQPSIQIGTTDAIKYYLGWAYSAFMAYCLLFVMPIAKTHHKIQYLPFLIAWILMGLVFIGFSVMTERTMYTQLLGWKGENKWTYYVHSFFHDKNPFGAMLFCSFVATLVLAQQLKLWGKIPLWVLAFLYFGETIFIRCSTAVVAEAMVIFVLYFANCFIGMKKRSPTAWVFFSLGMLLLILSGVAVSVPSVYEAHALLLKAHNLIVYPDYSTRVSIWNNFLAHLTEKSALFGWGPLSRFINGTIIEGQPTDRPLEDAYIDVYAAGGIVFLAFYLWVLGKTFGSIWKTLKEKPALFAGILACFIGCLVYGLAESNHYVFSSSSLTFVASFVVAAIPATEAHKGY